jgi:hypothetical protein
MIRKENTPKTSGNIICQRNFHGRIWDRGDACNLLIRSKEPSRKMKVFVYIMDMKKVSLYLVKIGSNLRGVNLGRVGSDENCVQFRKNVHIKYRSIHTEDKGLLGSVVCWLSRDYIALQARRPYLYKGLRKTPETNILVLWYY